MISLEATKVQLPNGRKLAYTQFGDPTGNPLLFFHGWPGARLQGVACDEAGKKSGIRIIAIDRPGFGHSHFQPKRTLLDWPDDVAALADALSIDQFAVLGLSGGGPYALACAYKLPPERLLATAVIAGVGPSDTKEEIAGFGQRNQTIINTIRKAPWLVRFLIWNNVRKRNKNPEKAMDELIQSLPKPDQIAISDPTIRPIMITSGSDTFTQGVQGHTLEMHLFASPWGFAYEDISAPIQLWHGEMDDVISIDVGKRAAKRLPTCQATFLEDEGHYSLLINQAEQIMMPLFT